ncbi:hypothetical protein KBZ19_07925 [Synechococcus sp. L2F]|jgi:putative transposase|uniref:hypothetical protein n=1 Tax=Synechococcus sp. L2F TaxID=2823739 RepID=UPI0020CE7D9C|nr:hypothetical protein [Synechococcus sp. L2F]MCP9828415.1 hypothetical protein [Synechococcus sp. L2F]
MVLSEAGSNSMDTEFSLEALEMPLEGGRRSEVFHSDQGSKLTSIALVRGLQSQTIKISWRGRKRCYNNILVERLWRTNKYEGVYLRACSNGWEAELPARSILRANPVLPVRG